MADKVLPDGSINIIKGKEAIELLKGYNENSSGYVTEEKLINARKLYNSSYDQKNDKLRITKELLEVDSLVGTINSLRFPMKDYMVIVPWKDVYIPIEYAENFYSLRQSMIKKYSDTIEDKAISNKIWSMEEKIKKPFYVGVNHDVWTDSIEWMSFLIIINMFIAMIIASNTFTDAKESGLYGIISKTHLGYKKFGIAKILSTSLFNTILYTIGISSYFTAIYLSLGGDGLQSSFQVDMAFSPGNLLLKDVILFQIIGGYIGMMSLTALSMLVSACCEKTKYSLITMISIYGLYELLAVFIRPSSHIINSLMDFSPFGIGQVFFKLPFYSFVNIGVVIWLPIAMCIFGIVQWILYNTMIVYKLKR